jgi:hypothetical protein
MCLVGVVWPYYSCTIIQLLFREILFTPPVWLPIAQINQYDLQVRGGMRWYGFGMWEVLSGVSRRGVRVGSRELGMMIFDGRNDRYEGSGSRVFYWRVESDMKKVEIER